MKFRRADDVILAFHRAHARAVAPAQSVGQSGRDYADRCQNPRCGRRGTRVEETTRKGELVPICSACKVRWTWTHAYVLAGQTHAGRGGAPPRALVRAGDLASIVEAFRKTPDLEPGAAWVFEVWLVCDLSREDVGGMATRAGIGGRTWDERAVRRAIYNSRRWIEWDLYRRGILDGVPATRSSRGAGHGRSVSRREGSGAAHGATS